MRQGVEVGLVAPVLPRLDLADVVVPDDARGDLGELDLSEVDSGAGGVA